jgi:hypothetical protein
MADIVFDIPTHPDEREFAHHLLRYAQGLAKSRQCERATELRYRWFKRIEGRRGARYEVVIDGDFAEIQAFGAELSVAVQHYGNGIRAVTPSFRRSLMPEVFRAALYRAIVERSTDFLNITRSAIALGALIRVNSYVFAPTGKAEIDRTLGALTQALIQWRNGTLAPSVLLEQLHTCLEVLLKRVLEAPNRGASFAQLVSGAETASLVSTEESTILLRLKDIRRDAKHRGQTLSARRLQNVLAPAVAVLQRLALQLAPHLEDQV